MLAVIGTRPDVIKMSPLIRALLAQGRECAVLNVGQHRSVEMMGPFLSDLLDDVPIIEKPAPMEFGNGRRFAIWRRDVSRDFLAKHRAVIVYGDTMSAMWLSILAAQARVRVIHAEAGLRSFDWTMPEEVARTTIDHLADLLLAPTSEAMSHLEHEQAQGDAELTGNLIVDALTLVTPRRGDWWRDDEPREIPVTIHRPENVDFEPQLRALFAQFAEIDAPLCFPIHPRTKSRVERWRIPVPAKVRLIAPTPWPELLWAMRRAALVITDSGGIQEECCILGVPCVTKRLNTERPETLRLGANTLVTDMGLLAATVNALLRHPPRRAWRHPYGHDVATRMIAAMEARGMLADTKP